MIRVAGILRKSPTKKVEESREVQQNAITERVQRDFEGSKGKIDWFFDVAKGDDPERPKLMELFRTIEDYDFVYVYNVDRLSRSYLGLHWFECYFKSINQPMLRFVYEVPDLYINKDDEYLTDEQTGERVINGDAYMILGIMTTIAQAELHKIRSRSRIGIARVMADPKLRKQKYPGGKTGRTWTQKKKKRRKR